MPTARRMFGEEFTHVVDCQHAEHPDLRGYRREAHRAVLLDEVASPQFVADNKKVLQAHVDGAKLGQSATQLYVYSVMLWRTPQTIGLRRSWCLMVFRRPTWPRSFS